jgi:hypothetical protein
MSFLGTFEDLAGVDFVNSMSPSQWNAYAGAAKSTGGLDLGSLLSAGVGGVAGLLGGGGSQKPTGYQGKVPVYQAVRQQVPMAEQDPARRPGSGGRQYFTNTQYLPRTDTSGIAAALEASQNQSNAIAQANLAPTQGERTAMLNAAQSIFSPYRPSEGVSSPYATPAEQEAADTTTNTDTDSSANENTNWMAGDGGYRGGHIPNFARGGLLGLAQGGATGYYLGGKTDGMADKIPATIANKQPAKLSHGEFVLPSDIVSALGSGNSEAGAKVLYDMMDRVRKHAHGTKKQIKPANLKKTLPA